jgi:hypothetical protein
MISIVVGPEIIAAAIVDHFTQFGARFSFHFVGARLMTADGAGGTRTMVVRWIWICAMMTAGASSGARVGASTAIPADATNATPARKVTKLYS